ncbi:hypothetical protein KR009_006165, partial [Drosophila setifemur]
MLKRDLQTITLKLSDLRDYQVARQQHRLNRGQRNRPPLETLAGEDASTSGSAPSSSSQPAPSTSAAAAAGEGSGSAPGSATGSVAESVAGSASGSGSGSASGSAFGVGNLSLTYSGPRSATPSVASYTNSTTPTPGNPEDRPGTASISTDDVSVAAVVDDTDTIDELSDDNWHDLNAETNTNDTNEEEDGARGGVDLEEDGARGGV